MDTSVALVQAYLHVNGYFTVAEYPVLESYRVGHARTVTDLDILAFRFAVAGHDVVRGRERKPLGNRLTDPILRCPVDRPDMIVGEVKEGAARLNPAMRDSAVLEVALARFGCCEAHDIGDVTQQLLSRGQVVAPAGHSVRMVAFGDVADNAPPMTWTTVPMRHVVQFLQKYLREHWDVLRHAQIRDAAFGVLALIEKWGVQAEGGPTMSETRRKHGGVRVRRGP
jgi:hypothetical protein